VLYQRIEHRPAGSLHRGGSITNPSTWHSSRWQTGLPLYPLRNFPRYALRAGFHSASLIALADFLDIAITLPTCRASNKANVPTPQYASTMVRNVVVYLFPQTRFPLQVPGQEDGSLRLCHPAGPSQHHAHHFFRPAQWVGLEKRSLGEMRNASPPSLSSIVFAAQVKALLDEGCRATSSLGCGWMSTWPVAAPQRNQRP